MNITITGDIGSGKSTVAKMLSNHLSMKVVEAGALYREYAVAKNVDVLEQNESNDYSIDRMIDSSIQDMGATEDNIIFVSRTAWHFVPDAIKVYICINPVLAAKRVLNDTSRNSEKHSDWVSTYKYNEKRKNLELNRYRNLYHVQDPSGLSCSDIIIYIGNNRPAAVCECIRYAIENNEYGTYIDPAFVLPTQSVRDFNMGTFEDYKRLFVSKSILKLDVSIIRDRHLLYIKDGHHRIAAAVHAGVKFIKIDDITDDVQSTDKSCLYDWEDLVGISLENEIEQQDRQNVSDDDRISAILSKYSACNVTFSMLKSVLPTILPSSDDELEDIINTAISMLSK